MSQPSVTELLFLLGLGLLAWILWYLSQLRETLKDIGADLRSIHRCVRRLRHFRSKMVSKRTSGKGDELKRLPGREPHRNHKHRLPYCLGEKRVATLALLTFTALSGSRSCGVTITKVSDHAVTLRSSPTVFADTPMSGSTSTRILTGRPPRAM